MSECRYYYAMTTETLHPSSVSTRANVFFDGKCVSHTIHFADGSRKSVGVILPSTLTFNIGAPEIMECTGGACEYRVHGQDAWNACTPGQSFSIPANGGFDIRVAEAFHYICHFG